MGPHLFAYLVLHFSLCCLLPEELRALSPEVLPLPGAELPALLGNPPAFYRGHRAGDLREKNAFPFLQVCFCLFSAQMTYFMLLKSPHRDRTDFIHLFLFLTAVGFLLHFKKIYDFLLLYGKCLHVRKLFLFVCKKQKLIGLTCQHSINLNSPTFFL